MSQEEEENSTLLKTMPQAAGKNEKFWNEYFYEL